MVGVVRYYGGNYRITPRVGTDLVMYGAQKGTTACLAMEAEWTRAGGDEWTDWSGRTFNSAAEWAYVVEGAAVEGVLAELPAGTEPRS